MDGIIHLCPLHLIWPVLVAFDLRENEREGGCSSLGAELSTGTTSYPALLLEVGEHDNGSRALFPHHPPEIGNGGWHWTLSRYKCILLLVPLSLKNSSNIN